MQSDLLWRVTSSQWHTEYLGVVLAGELYMQAELVGVPWGNPIVLVTLETFGESSEFVCFADQTTNLATFLVSG